MDLLGIRKLLGDTQSHLGKVTGIGYKTVVLIERGEIRPTKAMKKKIKDFCDKNNIDFARYDECEAGYHISAMYGIKY